MGHCKIIFTFYIKKTMMRYKSEVNHTSGKILFLCLHFLASASFHLPDHVAMRGILGRSISTVLQQNTRGIKRTNTIALRRTKQPTPVYRNYSSESEQSPLIVFPGGGIYFWWQVGFS